jgi:hypothetical protein
VTRRTLVYVGIGLALLIVGRLVTRTTTTAPPAPTDSTATSPTGPPAVPVPTAQTPLRRPPNATTELGVLTDRADGDLRAIIDREALAARVTPDLCGDAAACDAVRAALRDEHTTKLDVSATADWEPIHFDVDAATSGLTAPLRASIPKRARTVVVHVATAPSAKAIDVRAGFAAAAAVALQIDGLVYDQVLARIESARDFAKHAVTEPLGDSTFRKDRIELYYVPKSEGVLRVLTAGLLRWGAPDVDAIGVPTAASERLSDVVLGVAAALAGGLRAGPVTLAREDLARARGEAYPEGEGLPPSAPVTIDLATVHPETGDPNDFYARIEPNGGEGPVGYLELAERFFGPVLGATIDDDAAASRRDRAQRDLPGAIARWERQRAHGGTLLVQLPFAIPGDAGSEWMWIEVQRVDARTVTGKLADDPLGATGVSRGDTVTRPRTEVVDLDVRGLRGE